LLWAATDLRLQDYDPSAPRQEASKVSWQMVQSPVPSKKLHNIRSGSAACNVRTNTQKYKEQDPMHRKVRAR
jgi:hypothetical protein